MKSKSLFVFLVLILAIVPLFVTDASEKKQIKLSFASFFPTAHHGHTQAQMWCDGIEKATDGRVKITLYPGGSLIGAKDMYDGVMKGIADIGTCLPAYSPGRFPLWNLFSLPNGMTDCSARNQVEYELFNKYNPKEWSETKVLLFYNAAPNNIWGTVPIRTMEDFKGVELRVFGDYTRVAKLLGATPVAMPQGEVYEAMSKGIVKCTWSSADVLKGYQQADIARYLTICDSFSADFYYVMNLSTWNDLPADIQKIIDDYDKEFLDVAGKLWMDKNNEGIKYAKDKGMEIYYLPAKEKARWHDVAFAPMINDYLADMKAKGLPGQELLDDMHRLWDKYAKKYGVK